MTSIFCLVRTALALKHQKCFTPLPLQGLCCVPTDWEGNEWQVYAMQSTLLQIKQRFYFSMNYLYFSNTRKYVSLKIRHLRTDSWQTLWFSVTFLGKFQNRDNFYLLAEVFGDEGGYEVALMLINLPTNNSMSRGCRQTSAHRWDPQPEQSLPKCNLC